MEQSVLWPLQLSGEFRTKMIGTLITEYLLALLVACCAYGLWRRRHVYHFALTYPCAVVGVPPLGAFLYIGSISSLLPFLQRQWARCRERTACIWLSLTPFLFTADAQVVEQILTLPEFLEKAPTIYEPVTDVLKGGMIALPAREASRLRRIFAPALRHKKLLGFMPIFNSKSQELLAKLDAMCERDGGAAHSLSNELHAFTMGVSRRTTMGHTKDSNIDDLPKNMERLLYCFRQTMFAIILNCANLKRIIQFNPFFIYASRKLYDMANEIITYRARTAEEAASHGEGKADVNGNENENVNGDEPFLFIDQAFKYYKSGDLSWNAVVGESNGLLVATYETTSSALYSTLVLLAMHPDIQQRVFEEIVAVWPSKDVYVEYEHFKQLNYLEMVINEALRLCPPAPMIARQVTQNTVLKIEGKDVVLPSQMQLIVDIYQLHREKSVWGADAHTFNPDHFLPQNIAERSAYAFIPFSKGPRNCMGWSYAYFVMKVLLVHILRNYKLSTQSVLSDMRVRMSVFLEYETEPLLLLQRRD